MSGKENYNTIPMIEKACQVVELLSAAGGEAGISELAAATGYSKSTVFRILYTLQSWGWVTQEHDSGRYRMGLFFLKAGEQVKNRLDLRSVARPVMERLAAETGESVNLGVAFEDQVLVVESVCGEASLLVSKLDPVFALYCSAMGKLFLSRMKDGAAEAYFSRQAIKPKTINTITDRQAMKRELAAIRQEGFSMDREEYEYGLMCIAAPVVDGNGNLVAAISVSGPAGRMEQVKGINTIKEAVQAAAEEICRNMGYRI